MKILLVYPDLDSVPYLPLGIATLAAVLEGEGHDVTVWDLHAERWDREEVRRKISEIDSGEYGMVGISAMSHSYLYVQWLVAQFQRTRPELPVVLGGPLPSTVPEIVIREIQADRVVIGEGEETLPGLIQALEGKRSLSSVAGIAYLEEDRVVMTPARESIRDLDRLPFPAWHLMPMQHYLDRCERLQEDHPSGIINLIASRGCPYDCCYCDHTIKGYGVRRRSVENVIGEVRALREELGERLEGIYFVDDSFTVNREWILDFCAQFLKIPDRPLWTCNTRVDLVDRELLTAMKEAGCTMVRYGFESGSPRILKMMAKKTKREDFIQVVQLSRELKLHTIFTLMVGMIEETEESIQESEDALLELLSITGFPYPITLGVFIATPYPGTRLFEMARQKGKVRDALDVLNRMDRIPPVNLTDIPDARLLALRDRLQNLVLDARIRKLELIREACRDIQSG